MVSNLTVIKHNRPESKYPAQEHRIKAAAPDPSASHATKTLTKNTPGQLGRKITKPIRNQTSGKELGRGIRRTKAKTIGDVAQSKRPGRRSRGITSEPVNKWSIISVNIYIYIYIYIVGLMILVFQQKRHNQINDRLSDTL